MKSLKYTLAFLSILATTAMMAQTYQFKAKQATIEWTGKKVGGSHNGFIKLKEGTLTMDHDHITSGLFTIDMASISNTDLKDEGYNKKLIGHLSSDDFFGVATFPEAMLTITESTPFENNVARVKGDLTIKGITHPVEFIANYTDHKLMASIVIDRSKYNVRYGSKSFFNNLGDKMIYDEFTLNVTLILEH